MSLKAIISPSMLSSDLSNLKGDAQVMLDAGADWLHMDVMDGHFVPNLTLGAPVIKCLRKNTTAFLDCHLMVSEPEKWVDDFAAAGANSFTFHIEATKDAAAASALCDRIRDKGMKCAISIKPKTDLNGVVGLIEAGKVDMILVMTVEPGFGGQSFMADMLPKVVALRKQFPTLNIQVDGGVNVETIDQCAEAGANVIVSGSGVFKHESPKKAIEIMRMSVEKAMQQKA